jgi:hypothetical protein
MTPLEVTVLSVALKAGKKQAATSQKYSRHSSYEDQERVMLMGKL